MDQIGIGQLHWSTANYQPLQERALWDGLVALHDQVRLHLSFSDLLLMLSHHVSHNVYQLDMISRCLVPCILTVVIKKCLLGSS